MTYSFCASMMMRVESKGEAVEGAAPVSSRNDFAVFDSPIIRGEVKAKVYI